MDNMLAIINAVEVNEMGSVLDMCWDCVTDTDEKWWLAHQMYLKGVHDMAQALRDALTKGETNE